MGLSLTSHLCVVCDRLQLLCFRDIMLCFHWGVLLNGDRLTMSARQRVKPLTRERSESEAKIFPANPVVPCIVRHRSPSIITDRAHLKIRSQTHDNVFFSSTRFLHFRWLFWLWRLCMRSFFVISFTSIIWRHEKRMKHHVWVLISYFIRDASKRMFTISKVRLCDLFNVQSA